MMAILLAPHPNLTSGSGLLHRKIKHYVNETFLLGQVRGRWSVPQFECVFNPRVMCLKHHATTFICKRLAHRLRQIFPISAHFTVRCQKSEFLRVAVVFIRDVLQDDVRLLVADKVLQTSHFHPTA